MTIETQINLNMTNNQAPVVVDVVQGEQLTRVISATLYDGAEPWSVPGDVKAGLAFRKPDGTGGLYDELPNKKSAVTVSGNTVKATLAPQVQSVAGDVAAAIVFMVPSTMERLATFPFVLRVATDPSTGSPASNNYYQYSTMEEVNAAIKDVQASANAATEAVAGFQRAVASAIPVTMTGAAVSTDMVSPVTHEVNCTIRPLNEFNNKDDYYDLNGITHVWDNKQRTLKVTRESTGTWTIKELNLIPGKSYSFSCKSKRSIGTSGGGVLIWGGKSTNVILLDKRNQENPSGTFLIPFGYPHVIMYFYSAWDGGSYGYTDFSEIQIRQGEQVPYVPYIDDLSNVLVTRYGTNLFDKEKILKSSPGTSIVGNELRFKTIYGSSGGFFAKYFSPVKGLNFVFKVKNLSSSQNIIGFNIWYADGTRAESGFLDSSVPGETKILSFKTDSSKTIDRITSMYTNNGQAAILLDESYITIDADSVFEEPNIFEAYPDVEGNVLEMPSVSPKMTILTDNSDVRIEATYNADTKKYIDKKFAELQAAIISTGGNV